MKIARPTTALEKLLNSAINVALAFVIVLPLWLLVDSSFMVKRILFLMLFLLLKLTVLFFHENRSPGMIITKTYWKEKYPLRNQLLHAVLYMLSFSTVLFWVYFPFDLLLINILLIQLPTVLKTGTTAHGYLAGKMFTVKYHNVV